MSRHLPDGRTHLYSTCSLNLFLFLPFLFFMTVAAFGQRQGLPDHLQPLFNAGVEAQRKGNLNAAEEAFLKVIEQGGKVAIVYNNLGAIYQLRHQHAKALEEFNEAIRQEPDFVAPRILAGASLMAQGRTSEATMELQQAVRLRPDNVLARLELAKAYDESENMPGLIEQYQKLREIDPKNPEYAYQLGRAFMQLAAWCASQIEKLNPNSPRVFQAIANSYVYRGEQRRAIDYLKRAILLDPKLPDLHLALAQLYAQQGQIPEAIRELDQELAIVPNSLAAVTMKENLAKR